MEGKEFFALLNACMNGLCTVLLVTAFVMIKRKKYAAHGYFMSAAFLVSSVFLCSYLYSHYAFGERTTMAMGLNSTICSRSLYLVILVPHVILAVVMLPFILTALWRAYRPGVDATHEGQRAGVLDLAVRQRDGRGGVRAAVPRPARRRRGPGGGVRLACG